jgi:hypothetical protein
MNSGEGKGESAPFPFSVLEATMNTDQQRGNAQEPESIVSDSSGNGPAVTSAPKSDSRETERSGASKPADAKTSPSSLARKLTGPRTPAGKRRSRYNALKTGIFAKGILLKGESPAEFGSLLTGFREVLQPQGALEILEVEYLAVLFLRRRRVLRAENAEIAKVAEFQSIDFRIAQAREAWDHSRTGESLGGMIRHISNPLVLQDAIDLLTLFRDCFEKSGSREYANPELLRKLYGLDHPDAMPFGVYHIFLVCSKLAAEAPKENENGYSPEDLKKFMLTVLDLELERLKVYGELQRANDWQRCKYQTIAALVPSQDVLDRLIRSEAHLSREIDRTLNRLERAQRLRLGQPVLPPLRVELSK